MWGEFCEVYSPSAEFKAINLEDVNLYVNAVHKRKVMKSMGMKNLCKKQQNKEKKIDLLFGLFLAACVGFTLGNVLCVIY